MSVIPFVLNGDDRTIVENRQEYSDEGGLDGTVIFIQNLDIAQICDTQSSNASYDLRIGDEYRDHRERGKTDLREDDQISLQPGAAVIIETAESVQFPKTRFGHIVPKVSLLQDGLSNTSSKVDPGYEGRLLITVFNLGKRTVTLKKGQKFCTLYVLGIEGKAVPYSKSGQRIFGSPKKDPFSKAKDFIEVNQTYFTIVLTIFTIILTIATTFQVLQAAQK
ncbi:MAG: hypothetical protein KME10_06720 [Plectolyngbya sp. WJT66-NPBG17]|jgi:deoxycytidine triphosphate deaminase|nr:hypothetical protein [Plectolyngbya sp. WJT66-NPBG17]